MLARHVRQRFVNLLVSLVPAALLCGSAHALPRYGPLEISGNVSAQELIRHPDIDTYSLVEQRNTFKLRVDYSLLEQGQLLQRIAVPFIAQARLFLLYRGVYDSVYDYTPGFEQRDIYGKPSRLRLDDLSGAQRDSIKFENELREAYLDLSFKEVPLSFRLGRQQIVWGETDNFRLLDRVNALDLTWHLQQESWDELRIPYWMIKGLWDFGQLGPFSSTFMEFYWNPGDWYPARRDFLPRPWSAPIENPLTPAFAYFHTQGLANGTKLFRQGDYTRDPMDNSQVGARVSSVFHGVQFTLNYFYQRWAGGDDGTNSASIKAVDPASVSRTELPVEFIAPYVHTAGVSLNYAEEEYTQTVFRMETIYERGVPFTDASKKMSKLYPGNRYLTALDRDVFGVSKRDMWKGMLAFDRPTWIRPLNRNSTFLILGQFFWHHLFNNPDIKCARGFSSGCGGPFNPQIEGFRGQFSTSGVTPVNGTLVRTSDPFVDKVRDWEALVTLAATTFYRGGKIVPLVVYVLDPVNKFNMEVNWAVDYFLTNNLILNVSQRYFINTTEQPVFESWGVGGINRGRSETGIRLTYQF
ncbi:MAG: DUF1302 family protein [Candidatus Binatia bacterium]